jgi:predicted HTH transcriptional regulator
MPPYPRNPLLADPLFLARYIERAGTGTLDMIALSRDAGLRQPEFRQDGGQFVQTLWRPLAAARRRAGAQDQAPDEAQEAQVELTMMEEKWLVLCGQGSQSGQALLEAAGYTARTGNFKRSLEKLLPPGC